MNAKKNSKEVINNGKVSDKEIKEVVNKKITWLEKKTKAPTLSRYSTPKFNTRSTRTRLLSSRRSR